MKVLTIWTRRGEVEFLLPDDATHFDGQRIDELVNHRGAMVRPAETEDLENNSETGKEKGNQDV